MRKITIKRNKTFVGSLMKIKIYIVDSNSEEIIIRGERCKKIGDVKNNDFLTFELDENAHRIYAIVDTLSKDTCCDNFDIPIGNDDILITGKCKFSPFKGNPFMFDK